MGHIFNKKLLLTLTTLAYALNVSTLQASKISDDESFSDRAYSTVKSGAYGVAKIGAYSATAAGAFVAGVTVYEAERETLLHARNQMIHYGSETVLFLADNLGKLYNSASWALNEAWTWTSNTYMPYHPAVCDGVSALYQLGTDHPYMSAGLALAATTSIGIAYFYGKNKTSHAIKVAEDKEAAAIKGKLRAEKENAKLLREIEALKSAQNAENDQTPIVTQANPTASSDNHGAITSSPVTHGGQGGSVTLNIMMTPDMMQGKLSSNSQGLLTLKKEVEVR